MTASPALTGWALAYRPLRRNGLLLQLVVLGAAETALFASYRGHDAGFHWATHFLVGLSVAALTNLAWLSLKGAPARFQLASVLGWHLVAMLPDLLFSAGIVHDDWMDLFLGHVSSHDVPGGAATWLFLAVLSSAMYAVVLTGWLNARASEARQGMAPAIGVGGRALIHPQGNPVEVGLAHEVLGPEGPPAIVLLHGLGASREVWRPVATRLAAGGPAVLMADLLGFGASRSIGTRFGIDDHVAAVAGLLHARGADRVLVVGHSFGCAVAVALVASHPELARGLVLVSPPVFRDGEEARLRLGRRGWLARRVLSGSPVASLTCGAMCLLRAPAAYAVVRQSRNLPEAVARDGVEHVWPAYRDALDALLHDNPLPAAIEHPTVPTTVVVGDADPETPAEDILAWPHDEIDVTVVASGDHLLPLRHADQVVQAIRSTGESS